MIVDVMNQVMQVALRLAGRRMAYSMLVRGSHIGMRDATTGIYRDAEISVGCIVVETSAKRACKLALHRVAEQLQADGAQVSGQQAALYVKKLKRVSVGIDETELSTTGVIMCYYDEASAV